MSGTLLLPALLSHGVAQLWICVAERRLLACAYILKIRLRDKQERSSL